jgi:tricorn protease
MSDAQSPVFDKNGKYLYFTASTNAGPALEEDIQRGSRQVTASVYLAVLSKSEASPLAPESDDEKKPDEAKKDEAKKDDGKKDDKDKSPEKVDAKVEVKVEFDKIGQRILALPMPPPVRSAGGGQGGRCLRDRKSNRARGDAPPLFTVHRFDLKQAQGGRSHRRRQELPGIVLGREDALPAGRQVDHRRTAPHAR